MQPGDRICVSTPGGGGYGDPFKRDPLRVAQDVARGYYTAKQAESLFGVRLGADGAVDSERTDALRNRA
jgi:N-methylhydantoinase B